MLGPQAEHDDTSAGVCAWTTTDGLGTQAFLLLRGVAEARKSMLEDSEVFQHWAALLRHTAVQANVCTGNSASSSRLADLVFGAAPQTRVFDVVQGLVDKVQGDFHDNAATLLALSVFLQTGRSEHAAEARR